MDVTVDELSNASDVPAATIERFETGGHISTMELAFLAEALDVSFGHLIGSRRSIEAEEAVRGMRVCKVDEGGQAA